MNIPSVLLRFTGTVRTYLGTDGRGERVYADAASFKCFAETKRRMVRNPTTGDEMVSGGTAWARRDAAGGPAAFVPGSLVTINGSSPSTTFADVELIDCLDRDSGGLGAPDHLELILP